MIPAAKLESLSRRFAEVETLLCDPKTLSDPAALVDEASAMSLFGGKRAVWIEPATRDIEDGVAALFEAPAVENPVIAIAGVLTKTSALLKMAEASPLAVAFASYAPEGRDAERMVADMGRRYGLKIVPQVAARIADASGNDNTGTITGAAWQLAPCR